MDTSTVIQLISALSNVLLVVVFAAGYYILIKIYQRMTVDMERQHLANGRPQVIVTDNYADLPQISVVVNNISEGAAKDITFEFSAPVESSDGFVLSDLPYFKDGMDFLSPGGKVSAYWDNLDPLLQVLREKGLENGISVTTRYKDLAGESYETEWNLNPFVYKHDRYVYHKGIPDLVEAVERLAGHEEGTERYRADSAEERSDEVAEEILGKEDVRGS